MAAINPGAQTFGRSGVPSTSNSNSNSAVQPTGILVIDKPDCITSHDVVNRVRRLFGTKRVGHAGTLDPLATGVLVLCLGHATRIAEYLAADSKEYLAGAQFGRATDSQDITGQTIEECDASALTETGIRATLDDFRGPIQQIPPMVSAVHHEGKRLYELARKGQEVERQPRQVVIHRLDLREFHHGPKADAVLGIECSSGTYIRTLIADIGARLGTGATMTSLRRTRSGPFDITAASTLEALNARRNSGSLLESLLGIQDALADWPQILLTESEIDRISHGQPISAHLPDMRGNALLLNESGETVAVAAVNSNGMLAPIKVFI